MQRIDSHQHFWKFDPVRDSWITSDMSAIQRDFLPSDLQKELDALGIDGSVAVQSDQSEADNDFLLDLASASGLIKGIVGWVDLRAGNIEERLDYYSQFDKIKGFRHVLQGESDRSLMLRPEFQRGIAALAKHGFTYDILIFADQLKYAAELAGNFPEQPFVLDHIAKPFIKDQLIDDWAAGIHSLAAQENVSCKVSGMVTEADWHNWKEEDFKPYLDVVFEAFGPQRLMFGSDWPVCLVAGSYQRMFSIVEQYAGQNLSAAEQAQFFGGNACKFYSL